MKRVKLINDPAELVALFRAIDSEERRNIMTTLSEGWTMISDLVAKHGDGANGAITYFEKFKLIESRWEVNSDTGRPEKSYRTFYNAFQISTSLTFDEAQELLTVFLLPEKEFNNFESEIVKMIGSEGTFANDISKSLNISSLKLKGLVRRSVKFDFKGHNIVPIKEEE